MTSTSVSLGVGDLESSQQMEQQRQEEELIEPPTTSDRASKEVRQMLRDAKEFIETPRKDKRQRRQCDIYQGLVAQVA